MAIRPSEAAERAFARAGLASQRAASHAAAGKQELFNIAISSALEEMSGGLKDLAIALRQTFELLDAVNKFVRLP
jgi:hypothetical protein